MTLDNVQSVDVDPTANFITSGKDTLAEAQNKSASAKADENTDDSEASENDSLETDDSDGEAHGDTESKTKKGDGMSKRIKKLSKQRHEALSEAQKAKLDAEYWRAKALEGKEPAKEKEETQVIAKTESDGKPNPNDFDTNADYIDALTDWKLDQKDQRARELKATEEAKSEYHKQQTTHQTRVDEYAKANPTYKDDIESFTEEHGDYQFSRALTELIIESENGTAVLHKLALDKTELDRINSLSPMAAAREFGKHEARLTNESQQSNTETETKKISKAPAPISPVGSKASAATKKSLNDPSITFAEYEAQRIAELNKK